MKKIILLSVESSEKSSVSDDLVKEGLQRIEKLISEKYELIKTASPEEVKPLIDEYKVDICAAIIYKPSAIDGVGELLEYINKSNAFLFAVPVLVIAGEDSRDKDEDYLGYPVIGVIDFRESDKVIMTRIENASHSINSLSFTEFAKMLQVLPSLVYLKDADGRYVFSTQYWHHLDHYDDPDWTIAGKTDIEIRKDTENAIKAMESDKVIIKTGVGTSYIIEENEDDQQEFLQLIKEPLKDETGKVKGIIALINNVTEEELLRRKLEKISYTDELTGVYNRTFYEKYVKDLKEDIFPLSIISADCDNLKKVNDRYGHMVGDEYIRMSITMMKTILPEDAIICRTGGDEFVIFLERTNSASARRYINILNEMEDIFQIVDQKLSVSFGCCTAETYSEDLKLEDFIAQSDTEMYKCKNRRKQRQG